MVDHMLLYLLVNNGTYELRMSRTRHVRMNARKRTLLVDKTSDSSTERVKAKTFVDNLEVSVCPLNKKYFKNN